MLIRHLSFRSSLALVLITVLTFFAIMIIDRTEAAVKGPLSNTYNFEQ